MTKHKKETSTSKTDNEKLTSPDPDFLISFWNKNSRIILQSVAIIVLAFAAIEGWEFFQKKRLENLQTEYQQATTFEEKIAFAESNNSQPLAGLAFLSAADDSYENRFFEKSAEFYKKSLAPLTGTPLASRATLGLALSKIQLGDNEGGHALLEGILEDKETLNVFKAEASYQLATIALEQGDFETAKTYLQSINSFPFSGMWSQKAEILMEGNPHLKQDS